MADLDKAIAACQEAVDASPGDHPARARWLSNLGAAVRARFERTEELADLDKAIAACRQAVDATPSDYPGRAAMLTNLGLALRARFAQAGVLADLDDAIAAEREAVNGIPGDHPRRAAMLSNLGLALRARSAQARVLADLDEAITYCREAVNATPSDHPDLAGRLSNLCLALQSRFTQAGMVADLDEAITAGQAAVAIEGASPRVRAIAARGWGRAAGAGERWQEAVAGFEVAVGLVGRVAPRSLVRRDQELLLQNLGGLASEAAACCVHAGLTGHAVELFEQGRGILLSRALDARSDLTALAVQYPDLAERFTALRDDLDRADDRGGRLVMLPAGTSGFVDNSTEAGRPEVGRWQETAEAFGQVIAEIQATKEFAGFLQPLPVRDLIAAATDGPVVVVNVSRLGSHALILTAGDVEAVPLEDLTPESVQEQVVEFLSAFDAAPQDGERRIMAVLSWLWDVAAGPVLEQLNVRGRPVGESWPRLWWCVPGLLSFLPLHAAGHHHTRFDVVPKTVPDRVVSSYTPTIRALIHARRTRSVNSSSDRSTAAQGGGVVVVAMPHTPGTSGLPGAVAEADIVRRRFRGQAMTLVGSEATRDAVIGALPKARWAHFACHGSADLANPSASRLLLNDHSERPFTVVDVARLRLEHAELAFLSACSTARPGGRLADEAIHLASAFQLAGYRHVIGTLWPINDHNAVEVADELYTALATTGSADPAAIALHAVMRRLRNRWPHMPSVWASHIHIGA
jgi:hypothetical protein